jgi:hypothetical protein
VHCEHGPSVERWNQDGELKMWKFVALIGLLGSQSWAHDLSDQCKIEDLYLEVQAVASGPLGLPELAVFPSIEDVEVEQSFIRCAFYFQFQMSVSTLDGTDFELQKHYFAERRWDDFKSELESISVMDMGQ